jgi:hypothetical protein
MNWLLLVGCGGVGAAAVWMEHWGLPTWYPRGRGVAATFALGATTLLLAAAGYLAGVGALAAWPALAGCALGGIGAVAGVARRHPVPPWPWYLTGYGVLAVYCLGGTVWLLLWWAGAFLSDQVPLAGAVTVLLACGAAGTPAAYGWRWFLSRRSAARLVATYQAGKDRSDAR